MSSRLCTQGVIPQRWQPAPVWTLVFLAPFIAEVLSGATKMSVLFALIPEMMVWGCGALLIRELVRRWGGGWPSLLCLGLGLSIAEEFLIQQTSLAPLPFPGALTHYGRAWEVNWIYFLFMLGFESVWVVLVPVSVTELLFPSRSKELWLRTRGMLVAGVIFLLGCRIAWYAWIRRVRPMVFHLPAYHPAAVTVLTGLAGIAATGALAFVLRTTGGSRSGSRRIPTAWAAGFVVLLLGFPWYGLMAFVFRPQAPRVGAAIVVLAGISWAILAMLLLGRWVASPQWSDLHSWAAAFAATTVCMVAGFSGSSHWLRIDLIGKIALNAVAVLGFLLLLGKMRGQQRGAWNAPRG